MSELRVFFDFGTRAVPLLEGLGSFVHEIGPVIEGMKSLVQVTSEKLPKASAQLEKVNESSERASTEILNTIDKMIATIESIQTPGSDHLGGDILQQTTQRVTVAVDALANKHGADEDVIELMNAWHLHAQSLTALSRTTDLQAKLQSLHEDCTSVMMSLQIQDITGQQVASVIGLMQAIDDVLRKLLVEASEAIHVTQTVQQPAITAVPEYVGVDERKKMVESLLMKARTGDLQIDAVASASAAS